MSDTDYILIEIREYMTVKEKTLPFLSWKLDNLRHTVYNLNELSFEIKAPKGKHKCLSDKISEMSLIESLIKSNKEYVEKVEEILNELPVKDKVLICSFCAGKKIKKICKELKISEATFYRRKKSIIEKLRLFLIGK